MSVRAAAALVALLALSGVALARFGQYIGYPYHPLPNIPYDGRFTFVRVRYDPAPGGFWPGRRPSWIHGYPLAERNLMKIMNEVSFLGAHDDDINTVTLDDPELFRYPIAYIIEVGWWTVTDREAAGLRAYLLKGGFLFVDDFKVEGWRGLQGGGWEPFAATMRKVLPDVRFFDMSPDDPKYRLLKKMEQQSFRASSLVNNLLDLIANRPRPREIVSVPHLLISTLALHEDLLKAKQISVHVGDIAEMQVRGNFHDLQQVLTNVLLNARDAVRERGNIWIAAQESGERVDIQIRDDGKGIPRDLMARIFEPLVTTKRGQGGTGLGLAITRRILHASNGEIAVESAPGAGAEFTVTLPARE